MQVVRLILYFILGLAIGSFIAIQAHAYGLLTNQTEETSPTKEFKLLDAERLDMEYRKVLVHRDPYYAEDVDSFTYGAAVLFDMRLLKYGYWKNNVHMLATDSQVRAVGWEYEWGANVTKYFDTFYYHHSQHRVDRETSAHQYPLINEYGVRLHFLTK